MTVVNVFTNQRNTARRRRNNRFCLRRSGDDAKKRNEKVKSCTENGAEPKVRQAFFSQVEFVFILEKRMHARKRLLQDPNDRAHRLEGRRNDLERGSVLLESVKGEVGEETHRRHDEHFHEHDGMNARSALVAKRSSVALVDFSGDDGGGLVDFEGTDEAIKIKMPNHAVQQVPASAPAVEGAEALLVIENFLSAEGVGDEDDEDADDEAADEIVVEEVVERAFEGKSEAERRNDDSKRTEPDEGIQVNGKARNEGEHFCFSHKEISLKDRHFEL